MPLGLTNAPEMFQRLINSVLVGLMSANILVYFDDVLVFAETID